MIALSHITQPVKLTQDFGTQLGAPGATPPPTDHLKTSTHT